MKYKIKLESNSTQLNLNFYIGRMRGKIIDIKSPCFKQGLLEFGGSGEIRTHGGLTPSSVFKTGALNRSATLPCA